MTKPAFFIFPNSKWYEQTTNTPKTSTNNYIYWKSSLFLIFNVENTGIHTWIAIFYLLASNQDIIKDYIKLALEIPIGFTYIRPIPVAAWWRHLMKKFRVTGPLWGESTGHRWIPLTKASDAELWRFLWTSPEQTAKQTIETLVSWDAIALMMTSL